MDKKELIRIVEAVIFASDGPISLANLISMLEDISKEEVLEAIEGLKHELGDRSIMLKKVGGGYEFATRPDYSSWIKKMYEGKSRSRLTRAALETLAIIAFKQPISRVEVSAIRGVNSDGVIKSLLEKKMVTISGRTEGQGRALQFSTTKDFLRYFGIDAITDLPKPKEIEALLAEGEGGKILKEIGEDELLDGTIENSEEKPVTSDVSNEVKSEPESVEDENSEGTEEKSVVNEAVNEVKSDSNPSAEQDSENSPEKLVNSDMEGATNSEPDSDEKKIKQTSENDIKERSIEI